MRVDPRNFLRVFCALCFAYPVECRFLLHSSSYAGHVARKRLKTWFIQSAEREFKPRIARMNADGDSTGETQSVCLANLQVPHRSELSASFASPIRLSVATLESGLKICFQPGAERQFEQGQKGSTARRGKMGSAQCFMLFRYNPQ